MNQHNLCDEIDVAFKEFLTKCLKISQHRECENDVKQAIDDMLTMTMDGKSDIRFVCNQFGNEYEQDKEPYERLTGHEMGVCGGRV